jgi:hypothetical protein
MSAHFTEGILLPFILRKSKILFTIVLLNIGMDRGGLYLFGLEEVNMNQR